MARLNASLAGLYCYRHNITPRDREQVIRWGKFHENLTARIHGASCPPALRMTQTRRGSVACLLVVDRIVAAYQMCRQVTQVEYVLPGQDAKYFIAPV